MESGKEPSQVRKSLQAFNLIPRSLNCFTTIDVKFIHTRILLQTKVIVRKYSKTI